MTSQSGNQPSNQHPDQIPQTQPQTLPEIRSAYRLPSWRLWLPLLFQTALILAVPAQDAYTYAVGKQITLQTAPVDPYDLLRGHYQTLGYEIAQADDLKALPGGEWFDQHPGQAGKFYVVLEAPPVPAAKPIGAPQPWKPVRISASHPSGLAANQVTIQGQIDRYGRITYGIETYYMPEARRNELNAEIGKIQNRQAFVVDVKVDSSGNAVPISLWVSDHNYRF